MWVLYVSMGGSNLLLFSNYNYVITIVNATRVTVTSVTVCLLSFINFRFYKRNKSLA